MLEVYPGMWQARKAVKESCARSINIEEMDGCILEMLKLKFGISIKIANIIVQCVERLIQLFVLPWYHST